MLPTLLANAHHNVASMLPTLLANADHHVASWRRWAVTGLLSRGLGMIKRKMLRRRRTGAIDKETLRDLQRQAQVCADIVDLFRNGALILDEVDLVLHPLKSELNWPLGGKEPLDFTRSVQATRVFM
jgi:hypothetical protein